MSRPQFVFEQDKGQPVEFDLLVATCGYESRCSAVTKRSADKAARIVAFSYPENRTHSFGKNLAYFSTVGSVLHPSSLKEFVELLSSEFQTAVEATETPRIAIDISSFNRERLGAIVSALGNLRKPLGVSVSFMYSMATFDSHREALETTVLANGPLDGFEGWTSDPSRPVACVVGLGFENVIALAALETLEPAHTVAFMAQSSDVRFQERVLSDNASLLGSPEVAVVRYTMEDPFSTIHSLEGVVHALEDDYRVALVPLGPKLFATLALLVAWEYRSTVAVWRVSADQGGEVEDRIATGSFVDLHARIVERH